MWFVYTLLALGAIATIINLIVTAGVALLLVRFFESQKPVVEEKPEPKKATPKPPDPGLSDVTTSQIPYHRVEAAE